MRVARESSSVIALSWVGSRCGANTKAIPGFAGRAFRRCVNASSPPADAPTPTTGNTGAFGLGKRSTVGGSAAALTRCAFLATAEDVPRVDELLALAFVGFIAKTTYSMSAGRQRLSTSDYMPSALRPQGSSSDQL